MTLRSDREEITLEQILDILKNMNLTSIARRTNKSMTIEVDLTTPRLNQPLGIEAAGRTYSWLTIERCDDTLTYMLKQTDDTLSGVLTASTGRGLIQHEFKDIVVSNPASSNRGDDDRSICRFIVGWWQD